MGLTGCFEGRPSTTCKTRSVSWWRNLCFLHFFFLSVELTSSYTSLTAAPQGSSSGSIPPPGTIHWSGCRLLLTSITFKGERPLSGLYRSEFWVPVANLSLEFFTTVHPSIFNSFIPIGVCYQWNCLFGRMFQIHVFTKFHNFSKLPGGWSLSQMTTHKG